MLNSLASERNLEQPTANHKVMRNP